MDNVKQFPKPNPKSSPADAVVNDVLLTIARDMAQSALAKTPEQASFVFARIESALAENIPEWYQLPSDGKDVLMASVFYFIAVDCMTLMPTIRNLIAQHRATCKDHKSHRLEIQFGPDGHPVAT